MIRFSALICAFLLCLPAAPATAFFPLRDVKPGLRGIGRTVFQGSRIEEFQVEILGVLENSGPKQSIILAKLSGGPLAQTGVMQGMSGSPVYIDGKLLGAVALGFPFSKEPITGIQPIEQMVNNVAPAAREQSGGRRSFGEVREEWVERFHAAAERNSPPQLQMLATPLAFGGFSDAAVDVFATAWRKLGFESGAGLGSGAPVSGGYTGTVEPGSMISVELMSGDLNITADGTVTYVDGRRVYAFGHRFLASGSTDLPFARADVVTLLPNWNSSFKISTARELVGSLTSDVSTAVAGEMGRPAQMIPLHVELRDRRKTQSYDIKLVRDRLFTPLLTQMALFSLIDGTERTSGASTLHVRGQIEFAGALPPLDFEHVFAADSNAALAATFNLMVPLAFSLQAGYKDLDVKAMRFELESSERKQQLELQDAWLSKADAHPGESVDVNFVLAGENGIEVRKTAKYRIPVGAPTGRLLFTVSDANAINYSELAGLSAASAHSARQLVNILNTMRPNNQAYVRVWRQEPSFSLPGADLTDPPPSVALILSRTSGALGAGTSPLLSRGAQIAELPVSAGDYSVSGSKTIQLEVKE